MKTETLNTIQSIAIAAVIFFIGLFIGESIVVVKLSKPQNTFGYDTNSIQFRKSIVIDGNLYLNGKIYYYKDESTKNPN